MIPFSCYCYINWLFCRISWKYILHLFYMVIATHHLAAILHKLKSWKGYSYYTYSIIIIIIIIIIVLFILLDSFTSLTIYLCISVCVCV